MPHSSESRPGSSTSALEVAGTRTELQVFSSQEVVAQVRLVQEVMKEVMKEGEHYGTIPGTNKPTLYKSGAEKLQLTFRLAPAFAVSHHDLGKSHRETEVLTTLTHISTGLFIAQGVGSCSTMESNYRYREAKRACPECGQEKIIKGKAQYGGGWLCWEKKGGCGAKFEDGAKEIEDQKLGQEEYPNPADFYNTVLKMAKKRSQVDAALNATAASDIFTQDLEDLPGAPPAEEPKEEEETKTYDRCSTCSAPVTWGKTKNGKDCMFNPDGTSHFTTCPDAAKHSKKGGKKAGKKKDTPVKLSAGVRAQLHAMTQQLFTPKGQKPSDEEYQRKDLFLHWLFAQFWTPARSPVEVSLTDLTNAQGKTMVDIVEDTKRRAGAMDAFIKWDREEVEKEEKAAERRREHGSGDEADAAAVGEGSPGLDIDPHSVPF